MAEYFEKSLPAKKRRFPLAALGLLCVALAAGCAASAPRRANAESAAETLHWSYSGDTGPDYWYKLDSASAAAKDGKSQSPIDIETAALMPFDGEAPGRPEIVYRETLFLVENNGHTIQLTPETAGNYIIVNGEAYVLRQFHFHAPSEHRIDGKAFAMELHLVHQNADGGFAVMASMISEGAENDALKETFTALPGGGMSGPKVTVNPADLFNSDLGECLYEGSLTTPPCTEGVEWVIAVEPLQLSSGQIAAFKALYTENNRPVQPLNGRSVYFAR